MRVDRVWVLLNNAGCGVNAQQGMEQCKEDMEGHQNRDTRRDLGRTVGKNGVWGKISNRFTFAWYLFNAFDKFMTKESQKTTFCFKSVSEVDFHGVRDQISYLYKKSSYGLTLLCSLFWHKKNMRNNSQLILIQYIY